MVHSCDINNLLNARKNILKELHEADDTLLILNNNSLSLITNKLSTYEVDESANQNINVFQLTPDGPVLKNITKITKSINLEKLNKTSEYSSDSIVIVGSNDVYLLTDKIIKSKTVCTDHLHYFKKIDSLNYSYNNKEKEILLTKNQILNIILNNPDNLNKVTNEILLQIQSEDLLSSVRTINKKANTNVRNIRLKSVALGAQMSEAIIPFPSFQLANDLKDGNALHYLSQFKASKNPILTKENPKYSIGLKGGSLPTKLNLGLAYPLSNRSKLNIEIEFNDQIFDLASASISHKRFLKDDNYLTVRLGKFSQQDLGMLLNNQNYSLTNEAVLSLAGYTSLVSNCLSCVKSGLTSGFERYFTKWNSNFGGNYLIQNFPNRTENLTEIFLKKKFKSKSSILLKINHNIANNFASEFKLSYTIPLGGNNKSDSGNTNANITYLSHNTNRITDWLDNDSNLIFMNTPSHLRRNWNNYIDFD